ncbi:MAG: CheR family methyltransferase, partial [Planctomycetota bacterium]
GVRYEAVFCRNLLIYLTEAARHRVLAHLGRAMAPGAWLYVGHAELGRLQSLGGYEAGRPTSAFVCRLRPAPEHPVPAGPRRRARETARPARAPVEEGTRTAAPGGGEVRPVPPPPDAAHPRPDDSAGEALARAFALADQGRGEEAGAVLEALMGTGRASPDAYHLDALLRSARGDDAGAREALRRALYLDANHVPSLVQGALLADRRGDDRTAARYRVRLARVRAGRKRGAATDPERTTS